MCEPQGLVLWLLSDLVCIRRGLGRDDVVIMLILLMWSSHVKQLSSVNKQARIKILMEIYNFECCLQVHSFAGCSHRKPFHYKARIFQALYCDWLIMLQQDYNDICIVGWERIQRALTCECPYALFMYCELTVDKQSIRTIVWNVGTSLQCAPSSDSRH